MQSCSQKSLNRREVLLCCSVWRVLVKLLNNLGEYSWLMERLLDFAVFVDGEKSAGRGEVVSNP